MTILGVLVNNSLTASDHVSTVLASCASLMYALRVLRSHGLSEQSLKDVFQATVVGKSYCTVHLRGVDFVQLLTVHDLTRFYVDAIS